MITHAFAEGIPVSPEVVGKPQDIGELREQHVGGIALA